MGAQRDGDLTRLIQKFDGSPTYLGTIVATTTKNNHDTAAPFSNVAPALQGKVLMLQPDAACHILPGIVNTATVTTANGVYLAAYERVIITMSELQGWIAVVGAANVKVWEML